MRVFAYIRVSTEEQAQEGLSLPAQARAIENFCQEREWELVAVWPEERSGKDMHRAVLKAMLEEVLARKGEVGAIVVYKLDRLNRNQEDAFEIRKRLRRNGIRIVSVTEPTELEGVAGKITFSVTSLFNEILRDQIAERTKAVLADLKSQGGKYGHVPFGYRAEPWPERSNGRQRYRLVIDPAQQAVIQEMIGLRSSGRSYRAIARHLTVSRVPSPQAHVHRTKPCREWQACTVRRILKRSSQGE